LRAAGLQVNKEHGKWTRELVIAVLRRDAKRRGRSPTREDWGTAGRARPQAGTAEKLFGSWNAALRAAGLEVNTERDKWSPASVLAALVALERELGRQPTSADLQRPPAGYPNAAIVKRKLGSWGAACRELGWSCEQRVVATDEEMIEALAAAGRELGVDFTHEEYKAISGARGWPSANAITARFGSWNAARQRAGLPVSRRLERGWEPEQLTRALRRGPADRPHPARARLGPARARTRLAEQRNGHAPPRLRQLGSCDPGGRPAPPSYHVWQQDHNGFTHQDPGFLDHVVNKKADIVRVYLPPDANCLLSVANHCLNTRNYVNVIVAGKHPAPQWLTIDEAVVHCTQGIGIWPWASNDRTVSRMS
jgi:hypothetical protein